MNTASPRKFGIQGRPAPICRSWLGRRDCPPLFVGLAMAAWCVIARPTAAATTVNFLAAATGQTASAAFEFADGDTLSVVLRETTGASTSALTGSPAILTGLGFLLPAGQLAGGSAAVGPGSQTSAFSEIGAPLGVGAAVSAEWGYSQGTLPSALRQEATQLSTQAATQGVAADQLATQEASLRQRARAQRNAAAQILANNPDPQQVADAADLIRFAELDEAQAANLDAQEQVARSLADQLTAAAALRTLQADSAPSVDFVGVTDLALTAFAPIPPGTNLDGPAGLDGAQGGLLGDAAASGGLGVIDDAVLLTLDLSLSLTPSQQAAFLQGLRNTSLVTFGEGDAVALAVAAVPEASTAVTWVGVAAGLAGVQLARKKARPIG